MESAALNQILLHRAKWCGLDGDCPWPLLIGAPVAELFVLTSRRDTLPTPETPRRPNGA